MVALSALQAVGEGDIVERLQKRTLIQLNPMKVRLPFITYKFAMRGESQGMDLNYR
jgi:hypothetical protein